MFIAGELFLWIGLVHSRRARCVVRLLESYHLHFRVCNNSKFGFEKIACGGRAREREDSHGTHRCAKLHFERNPSTKSKRTRTHQLHQLNSADMVDDDDSALSMLEVSSVSSLAFGLRLMR